MKLSQLSPYDRKWAVIARIHRWAIKRAARTYDRKHTPQSGAGSVRGLPAPEQDVQQADGSGLRRLQEIIQRIGDKGNHD